MKKRREVINLPVIDLNQGKMLGRVVELAVNTENRKIEALEIGERALLKTKTVLLPFNLIHSIGSDAVTVSLNNDTVADSQAENKPETGRRLTDMKVITVDGTLLGSVADYSFSLNDASLVDLYICMDKPRNHLVIPVETVENFGQDFIIIRGKYIESNSQEKDPAAELHEYWQKLQAQIIRGGRKLEIATQDKIGEYVVGKKLSRPLYDQNGTLIGECDEEITEEIRDAAVKAGLLNQLFLSVAVSEMQTRLEPLKKQLRDLLDNK